MLSFVVPAFQVAPYLTECLDSLLADPDVGDEVEVVAVDDCSPDETGDLLDAYAERDPRLRVVHLATNVGLGRARNAGLEHARGEYVWFVDGDDWLPAGVVPPVLARLGHRRPDVLLLDHVEVRPDGSMLGTGSGPVLRSVVEPGPVGERPELLGLNLATSVCTKVIRRGLLDEAGLRFPPGWYEDCAFAYPLLLAAARIDTLDLVGYCYRQRPAGAITKSCSAKHFDIFEQYERMWGRIDPALPADGSLRPELFRLMVDHLLVIAGNERRLPPGLRRDFFRQVVAQYRYRLPAGGYRLPGGVTGWKHRLVRHNAYWAYATLRLGWRGMALRPRLPGGRRLVGRRVSAAPPVDAQNHPN